MSSTVEHILEHNRGFVARKEYRPLQTDRYPNKKIVVVTCMDTRLSELLPQAMDLRQGDAKILKTAGAVVASPFGSIMKSILVAVYDLGAEDVLIVGHHDCGMTKLNYSGIVSKALARGVSRDVIDTLHQAGIDLEGWLQGFDSVEDAVRRSVARVRSHPLLPKDVNVGGFVMCPETGRLDEVK